jgi:23S rRNA pseudouridine1911/1915/1917 synthase
LSARTAGFVVGAADAGERLDRLVVQRVPGLGRRTARELFGRGAITVDGRRVRAATPAVAGSRVECVLTDEAPIPEPGLALDVRLEQPAVVIVYKPAGQPTAPLAAGETGTLANALIARYPELAGIGHRPREPGLLHRLDTETSGLLVVARNAPTFSRLTRALREGQLEKRYLAIVAALELPASGVVDGALGPDPRRRGRVHVVPDPTREYAREAETRYRVLQRTSRFVLLELEAARAFRHQIRAHLASLGAPLVGDALYGGPEWPGAGERHALHASFVAWRGEHGAPGFEASAELPADMQALLGS